MNPPLEPGTPRYGFPDEAAGANTHSLFVCLTFSGGGTRAAALSYGVLEKLRDTQIEWKGQTKSLLDEVDCISSVSGGSFTAAYYGLFGDRIFQDFEPRFLKRFADLHGAALEGIERYAQEVRAGTYPSPEHSFGAEG